MVPVVREAVAENFGGKQLFTGRDRLDWSHFSTPSRTNGGLTPRFSRGGHLLLKPWNRAAVGCKRWLAGASKARSRDRAGEVRRTDQHAF
jgi:hypothetical protein